MSSEYTGMHTLVHTVLFTMHTHTNYQNTHTYKSTDNY